MIFRQIVHDDLGCASYLIGDEDAGVAAVVDPRLDVDEYLRLARYMGVQIEHVLETHNHADHVSGHGRLAAATGAAIHVHRDAHAEYEHQAFGDGWELELGSLRVRALHTPGHRPEHTAFALIDCARGPEPWAVLTGDSLFVGDIARPDLAIDEEDGARGIFHSLHDTLLALPPECEVWPAHLGGSMCGGPGMDMKVSSTIGYERAHQDLLRLGDEDEFVSEAVAALGPQPPNFENIVALNRGPLLTEPIAVEPGDAAGALIVDCRPERAFDEGHIPGAVCAPTVRAGFGTKLAWIAGGDDEVVLVGQGDDDAREAVGLAAAVGIRASYLAGGMSAWSGAVAQTERIDLRDLHERWAHDGLKVLDVREVSEWEEGHIPGSVHVPYHDIKGIPDGVEADEPIAVVCASGQRAAVGASLLQRHGAKRAIHVVGGGVPLWQRQGWPTE